MWRTLPLALIAITGCRGIDDPDTNTTDTAPPVDPDAFPVFFAVTASRFAVDDNGMASPFSGFSGGTWAEEPISLELSLGDGTVVTEGFTDDNSCTITFSVDEPVPPASWAGTVGAWTAFALPSDATAFSTCGALEFPAAWGDPVEEVSAWTWGFGVGELALKTRQGVSDSLGEDFPAIEPYLGGGGFYWDGLKEQTGSVLDEWRDGWVDTAAVFAYEVDAALVQEVVDNNAVYIEVDQVQSGNTVVRGLYDLQGASALPASVLLK